MLETIPLEKFKESAANPRHHLDKKALEELAASIRTHGVLTPLLVRPHNGFYEIAAGHRRLRAAKMAGVETIPAVVREMSDVEFLEIVTIENLQREDVHPLDEAAGYRALTKVGYDVERIADRVGRSVKYVYDRMKLTELTKEAKELFFDGRITAGHAILLARLKAEDQKRVIGARQRNAYHIKGGGLFVTDHSQLDFDGDEKKRDPMDELKPVSVRELQQWIDENVRFDPAKDDTPRLFPETNIEIAQAKEAEEKIVPITRNYHVTPDAKDPKGARTFGPMSWKPATGKKESEDYGPAKIAKPCERSVLGVFVVGSGRGETMQVCVDKACEIHWGKRPKKKSAQVHRQEQQAAQEKKWTEQQRREKEARERWEKATPAILEAIAEKVKTAKVKVGSPAALLVLEHCDGGPNVRALVKKHFDSARSPEDLIRRAAFSLLADDVLDDWRGPRELPKRAKAFGVDVAKILAAEAPKPAPAKVQTSGKKKTGKK